MANSESTSENTATNGASKSTATYKLSRIIPAHTNDVKALSSTPAGAIISASRDEHVKLFTERNNVFVETLSLYNGMMVNSVAFFARTEEASLIFCGRKNGSIAVYNAGATDPLYSLTGHSQNISVLQVCAGTSQLICGSWDATATVWNINENMGQRNTPEFRLTGHKNSIWATEFIPQQRNRFLTASADRTINLWHENAVVRTFSGHEDVVRCLLVLDTERFISASNDATICVWNTKNQQPQKTYKSASDEFIYSMIRVQLPDGRKMIATSGENGVIELWNLDDKAVALTPAQILRTPVASMWALRTLPGGDIAAAASNGYIYTFTARAERAAPADVLDVFEADVAAHAVQLQQQAAARATETVNIKVSMDEDQPPMNLAYKKGTDPALTADKFIHEHNIAPLYRSEIIEYIKQNVPEAREYNAANAQTHAETTEQQRKHRPRSDYVPLRAWYTFGYEGASTKAAEALRSSNSQLTVDMMLEDPLLDAIDEIFMGKDLEPNEIHMLALEKGVMQWPIDLLVPLLDAFRLGLLHPTINEYFCSIEQNGRGNATLQRLLRVLISDPPLPVRIVVMRSLTNAASHSHGREMLQQNIGEVGEQVARQIVDDAAKPALQLAACSFLANLSLILLRQTEKSELSELGPREDVLCAIIESTKIVDTFSRLYEPALFRLLQAIVTLMWGDATLIQTGKQRGIVELNRRIKDAVKTEEAKDVARDIFIMTTDN